ncbi:CapA family protein [Bradyrhizobium sp. CW9]|uniref:CapA family protein n=1 Tax=Bradyrhizobium sp. CW9 TaxID=2782689 RepID=UPI001FFA4AE4|nr:CapA family protein [Bradyrhizobium sp. CW9]MCK1331417.1 CapA family protein [Bradyrhizobium sp. CW9]
MRHRLPKTYVDIYRSPTFRHWFKMKAVLTGARLLGYWNVPNQNAAASLEEATFIDEAYCLYKNARPLMTAEDGVTEVLFQNDSSIVRLPKGFKKNSATTISAVGDLMPAGGLEASLDIMFEDIANVLFDADVSFANLEAPITEQKVEAKFVGGQTAIMGFSVSQFAALAGHRKKYFTALNFANNHTLDRGIEGIELTQKILDEFGIVDLGTPRCPEDYGRARVINRNGVKVGFISASYSLNGLKLSKEDSHRVHVSNLTPKHAPTDLALLRRQIADCKAQQCDFIIASLHWGFEFEFFPRARQVEAAHTLANEGVDLVLGHHPHVVQPVEYYRTTRDPNRVVVIAYSLNGLGMRWYTAPHMALGLLLNLTIAKGQLNGVEQTYIEKVNTIPIFQNIFTSYNGDQRIKRIERLDKPLVAPESGHARRYRQELQKYADLVLCAPEDNK